jgi:hypothetical protein
MAICNLAIHLGIGFLLLAVPVFILKSRSRNAATIAVAFILLCFVALFIMHGALYQDTPGGSISGGKLGGWTDVSDSPEGKTVLADAGEKGVVLYNAGARGAYKFVPTSGGQEILYKEVSGGKAVRA